ASPEAKRRRKAAASWLSHAATHAARSLDRAMLPSREPRLSVCPTTSTFSIASSRSSAPTFRKLGTIDGLGKVHPWPKRLGQRAAATPVMGSAHSPTGLASLRQAGYSFEPRLEHGPGGRGWIPSWPLKKNSSTRRSNASSAPSTAAVSSCAPDWSKGKYSPQPCTVTLILR